METSPGNGNLPIKGEPAPENGTYYGKGGISEGPLGPFPEERLSNQCNRRHEVNNHDPHIGFELRVKFSRKSDFSKARAAF
jgi:hypothetical protein